MKHTLNKHFPTLRLGGSDEEINFYIDNFKPFDKAGSYGIQEWIGFIGVKKIEGNYTTVMGFPVHKFYKEMMKF